MGDKLDVMFSTGKDDWETPDDLFQRLHHQYHFIVDAAANEVNHKVERWFGPGGEAEDALTTQWPLEEGNIWLNPPYSRGLQSAFVRKALAEVLRVSGGMSLGARRGYAFNSVVCLLPSRTDTKLFHDVILPNADVEFLRGRVKFKGAQQGAPFPSMIVVF